jgi:putative flippase GtrA
MHTVFSNLWWVWPALIFSGALGVIVGAVLNRRATTRHNRGRRT